MATTDQHKPLFQDGDVISIAGLYADGTKEHGLTPIELYQDKPTIQWRVSYVDGDVTLEPLNCALPLNGFVTLPRLTK